MNTDNNKGKCPNEERLSLSPTVSEEVMIDRMNIRVYIGMVVNVREWEIIRDLKKRISGPGKPNATERRKILQLAYELADLDAMLDNTERMDDLALASIKKLRTT